MGLVAVVDESVPDSRLIEDPVLRLSVKRDNSGRSNPRTVVIRIVRSTAPHSRAAFIEFHP
jgi:hypothetical protein